MSSEQGSAAGKAEAVRSITGTGIAVRGNDIDTDRIIPARYLKAVTFDGIGEFAFQDVRVDENGNRTEHPFNQDEYKGASVLIVNKNFGCGSSREHAPQALKRWGIRAIIGESFAEIFAGNCNTLGVPAVTVDESVTETLMAVAEANPNAAFTVNLDERAVEADGRRFPCDMPSSYRRALVGGTWDSTALLLQNEDAIRKTAESLPYVGNFA